MNNRNTIDTFFDVDLDLDIEIETIYTEGCRPTIKLSAYKGGECLYTFNAEHMDRYFLDELEINDEG